MVARSIRLRLATAVILTASVSPVAIAASAVATTSSVQIVRYDALVDLFHDWRRFARPAVGPNAAPDYRPAAMLAKANALAGWRQRLAAIDSAAWPIEQQNDYKLVRAEMSGLDFDLRVLRPWARDPAFYVSVWPSRTDVPAREAPVSDPEIHLYGFRYPLSAADQRDLTAKLKLIPPLLLQARDNLAASNARDLWIFGTHELRDQVRALKGLEDGTLTVSTLEGSAPANLAGASPALRKAVADARVATETLIAWLDAQAPTKTGPSGVGRENYTWYQQNVHFVPHSWEEEVALLRRELDRAWAALQLEEYDNRDRPPLDPVADAAAYDALAASHLDKFVAFLRAGVLPDRPYFKAALAPQVGRFVPADKRAFFAHVMMREPMTMLSHDVHWIDLARMRDEPNSDPIRRDALLSNIWDNRAEGFATAFEEILMHAGLYDDNPRAKELVWILLANRAARGLASLYVQANIWSLEEAGHFHGSMTPRGWSNAKDSLTAFEQLLYLRQPGYGTSYITGKIMFDQLMTNYAHQQAAVGKPFVLRELMGRFNDAGMIPTPLIETELVRK